MVVWQWDIQPTLTWFGLCPEKSGYPPQKNSLIIMMCRFVFLNDHVVYHSSIAHVWTIMDKPLRRVSIWKFWISEIEHGFLENHHLYISGWWFGTYFIFPYIGIFIIPTDYIIFFRGVGQPPTRYVFLESCILISKGYYHVFPSHFLMIGWYLQVTQRKKITASRYVVDPTWPRARD
jgi:hypothetical protein